MGGVKKGDMGINGKWERGQDETRDIKKMCKKNKGEEKWGITHKRKWRQTSWRRKKRLDVKNCSKLIRVYYVWRTFVKHAVVFVCAASVSACVSAVCFLLSGDECSSDPWQTEAEVLLGAEDCSAQRADGWGGEPREEQLPDTVSRNAFLQQNVLCLSLFKHSAVTAKCTSLLSLIEWQLWSVLSLAGSKWCVEIDCFLTGERCYNLPDFT